MNKIPACHNTNVHRSTDHYYIWQAADGTNTNVLMEIGQGDQNHPIGISPSCTSSSWWGNCTRPAGTTAYQDTNFCTVNRDRGVVSVGVRVRDVP